MSVIVTLAGRWVGVKSLYNPGEDRKSVSWRSDQLEIRCGRENQHPAEGALKPLVEQHRRTGRKCYYGQKSGGSICCSSVWSPTPSHTQSFQIKWKVYFSKRTVPLVFIVLSLLWFCKCMQMNMYYAAIQHNMIWCLEPGMSFMVWFRAWVEDPQSGQRQKEYST